MFKNYPDVVSVSEMQKMLNIGRNSAYRLLKTGKVKSIRIGRVHKITKSAIVQYIKSTQ
jgi:excisionase family DNA binding protein